MQQLASSNSKFMDDNLVLGSWWLFPKLGFVGLTARDYLGEILNDVMLSTIHMQG